MLRRVPVMVTAFLMVGLVGSTWAGFGAYYSRLNSGQGWEGGARVGPYADITVDFDEPEGKFIFWRASSYLAHWQTPGGSWYVQEVVPRSGDGSGLMPDRVNQYSRVKIIETSPARVIVFWRYVPNFGNCDFDGWVDEYFTVYPDGVCIRTIRQGRQRLDDWVSTSNVTVQKLRLESDGIKSLATSWQSVPELTVSASSAGKYVNEGFDETGRCYVLKCRKNGTPSVLEFTLDTAGGKSIRNPVIVVKNWGNASASVSIAGVTGINYKTGLSHNTEGSDLIVWIGAQSASTVSISVSPRGGTRPENKIPRVDAGEDQSLLAPADAGGPFSVNLEGVVRDDGLPNDSLTMSWSKVSGPGSVEFADANKPDTNASLSQAGTYKLNLAVNDGEKDVADNVIIVVKKDAGIVGSPAAWWKFDEGSGDSTQEAVAQTSCGIGGDKSVWKAGVSGTSLQFDGYNSVVTALRGQAPSLSGGLTLEAWVALGARPWNWAPIVHQSDWESRGYYLGLDAYGHLGFMVSAGGWRRVISSGSLPRYKWAHVVGTYDGSSGRMRLYMDGSEVGSGSASGEIEMAGTDLLIGRNNRKMQPTDAVRDDATLPSWYGFDGLIDEVKIYDRPLTASEVSEAYNKNKPDTQVRDNPPMQQRILPSGPRDTDRFGAYYENLDYYETWNNLWRVSGHPDVVVKFDESPVSVVFWRGTSYGPGLVTENNLWTSDQSVEEGGGGAMSCAEHMSDKQCRHAHARIIESTDARVVVHWRYALVDILYNKPRMNSDGWSDWVDEYFTFYPDGAGIRNVKYWSSDYGHYSLQDTQFLTPPGVRPEDVIELSALTVVTQSGESRTLSWAGGVPDNNLRNANIEVVNLKSQYKPFIIFEVGPHINPWGQSEKNDYTYWPTWNHWPVGQVLSDGRLATYHDRLTHSALGEVDIDDLDTTIMMYGVGNLPIGSLAMLARSWNEAPNVNIVSSGFSSDGYDRGQRAFLLRQTSGEPAELEFTVQASNGSPIYNPCFVIKNWKGQGEIGLAIDGQAAAPGTDFRTGIEYSTDGGTAALVVWVKKQSTASTTFKISPSSALAGDFNEDGIVNFLDLATFVAGEEWL